MHRHTVKWLQVLGVHWLAVVFACVILWGRPLVVRAESLTEFSNTVDSEYPFQFSSAMVIDQATGQVLYEHQPDQKQSIASLTKVLTLDIIYDHIKEGHLSLDTKVPISKEVAELSTVEGLSNVPLEESEDFYTVGQLIDAAMVASGNAAVVALAEKVSGSEANFVDELTHHLKDMGISDVNLVSATGLGDDFAATSGGFFGMNQVNQMTARDYLRAARLIIRSHPEMMERSMSTSVTITGPSGATHTVENQNELIPGMAFGRSDVTGGKTGTQSAGDHAVFVRATLKDRNVLAVVMGDGEDPLRYQDMSELLDMLNAKLEWHAIHRAGERVGGNDTTVSVLQGNKQRTTLYYDTNVGYFAPTTDDTEQDYQTFYKDSVNYDNSGHLIVKAPLETGESVNEIYYVPKTPYFEKLDNQSDVSVRVMPTESIDKVSFLVRITRMINDMIQSLLNPEMAPETMN